MAVTLPLRIPSAMQAGVVAQRVVKRVVRRQRQAAHDPPARDRAQAARRRPARAPGADQRTPRQPRRPGHRGRGGAGASPRSGDGPEQLVGVVHTDASGAYSYTAAGSTSRTLRFAYAGSPLILPGAEHGAPRRPRGQHVAGQPPSRPQRPARDVQRPGAEPRRSRRAESSSSSRCCCRGAGRRSEPREPTRPGAGRCPTGSRARAACSGIASAWSCPARRATRSAPALRSPCESA